MKTKKDILKWWEDLGQKLHNNDWKEFEKKIELKYEIEDASNDKNKAHKIKIVSSRWKWPLRLFFFKDECYRIVGF